MSAGVPRLRFSNDIRVFFAPDNPQLKSYEAVEKTYARSNSVLMVVEPADGDAFSPRALAAQQYLTAEGWKIPHATRVDSLTNFQHSKAVGEDLVVSDLVKEPAESLTPARLAEIRSTALGEPVLRNALVSADGRVAAVNVPVHLPGLNPLKEQPEVAGHVRDLAARTEAKFPGVKVRLTGIVMINQALAEAGERDVATLVPAMVVFIMMAMAWLLRAFWSTVGTLAIIILPLFAGFGGAGWLGVQISPPVMTGAIMILTLGVATAVHLTETFRHNLALGMSKVQACEVGMRKNLKAVFLTNLTTLIGYLTLNFSESPPFRDLGNVVSLGVVVAWGLAQILLPALMVLLPAKVAVQSGKNALEGGWMDRFTRACSALVLRYPGRVLAVGCVVSLGFSAVSFRNEFNDEFVKYFSPKTQFRQDTDFTIERLTGFEFIEYELKSGSPGGIAEPEYLRKVDAFAAWLRQQEHIRHVYSHTDVIKRLHRNLNHDDPAAYRIPENRGAATDCLTLYEMSLPTGFDLTNRINLDKSATLLRASLGHISSKEMIALDGRAQAWLKENNLSPGSEGTGQSMMFAHIGIRNIGAMMVGSLSALVLISLCMIPVCRSLRIGILSMLPNLAPAGLSFGIWALLRGEIGLGVSVVVDMTLGIVVDDTTHYMAKYSDSRRSGLSARQSVEANYEGCSSAMIITTILLVGGFLILSLSDFALNGDMGLLSAITIGIAAFFDLLILPALLICFDRDKKPSSPTPP